MTMRTIGRLVLATAAIGCAQSRLTAFRDPAHPNASYTRLAVFALGMELSNAVEVERQVCARLAPTGCVSGKAVLPPTRIYTVDEVTSYLGRADVDGVLIIALVADQADSRYLGTITDMSAQSTSSTSGALNFYRNSALWNSSTQTSETARATSTPVYGHSRTALAQVGMFERVSGGLTWRGELKVSGQGYANVTDGAFIRSATTKVAEQLRAAGLLR